MEISLHDKVSEVFETLSNFPENVVSLRNKIIDDRIERLELTLGIYLPEEFKLSIKISNGFGLMGTDDLGLDPSYNMNSLDKVYSFEHQASDNKFKNRLFPFSPDGFGNHYSLILNEGPSKFCKVAFWQKNVLYDHFAEMEVCNDSFLDWVEEVMIEWNRE